MEPVESSASSASPTSQAPRSGGDRGDASPTSQAPRSGGDCGDSIGPTPQAPRSGGDGGDSIGPTSQAPRSGGDRGDSIGPTSQAPRSGGDRGDGIGSNGGEKQVGILRREVPLHSLVLSLAPPMFTDDLNFVPPPPRRAPIVLAAVPISVVPPASRGVRPQRNPLWSPVITPPYPWATDRRAMTHSIEYLLSKGMYTIRGELICRKCKKTFIIKYDLLSKFDGVKEFIINNREGMHDRAPDRWNCPTLPMCESCKYPYALKPIVGKKRNINWLFLLLGQMLGCVGISQLKYLCKHTSNHRTGAKNRLLFLTYLAICKQLQDIPAFQYHIY